MPDRSHALLRILGVTLLVILALVGVVLHLTGLVKLQESLANLWFLMFGAGVVGGLELLLIPGRLAAAREKEVRSPLTEQGKEEAQICRIQLLLAYIESD
jgi:hypothetical protein